MRSTYRYTPLLAWALTPNIWISSVFGKLVFIAFDLLVGHLLYQILHNLGHSKTTCHYSALLWLFNPLCATVSSRGNAESVVAWLVLMSLYLLLQRRIAASAVFYALSVHFKIYPVTFALPIYLYLGMPSDTSSSSNKLDTAFRRKGSSLKSLNFLHFLLGLAPNKERLIFISTGAAVLGTLTAFFYWM